MILLSGFAAKLCLKEIYIYIYGQCYDAPQMCTQIKIKKIKICTWVHIWSTHLGCTQAFSYIYIYINIY